MVCYRFDSRQLVSIQRVFCFPPIRKLPTVVIVFVHHCYLDGVPVLLFDKAKKLIKIRLK